MDAIGDMIKAFSSKLAIYASAILMTMAPVVHAQEAAADISPEKVIKIDVPEGWAWVNHGLARPGMTTYICKKAGTKSMITVQVTSKVVKDEGIEELTAGASKGYTNSMVKMGKEVTTGQVGKSDGPSANTWSFTATTKDGNGTDYTRMFILGAPTIMTILCSSQDEKETEALAALIRKGQLVK